ncbi:MAG: carboxypeptidase regulatory-like domain-containing protein [Planctomycetes bacterium]|nr:carboxypeptidase regulatory-like domain-containing protein [Planctomycetota bacterium]
MDLVGHRGLWIRGRLQGEDGRALAQVQIGCGRELNPWNAGELQALANDEGRFRIGPLFPGTYQLRTLGGDGVFGWPSEATTVEAGASNVVLVLPSRHSIGGRVVDREGRAVDAHVHLLRQNSSLGQETSQREQGAFLFIALEPDTYSVQAEAPDGRVAVRSIVLAEGTRVEGIVLTLEEGTRIGVRHDLERYARCAIWAGDALAADSSVHYGRESFETVPAGPLRIELYSGDEIFAVRELIGRAGRVESVEFDLVPGD